MKRLISPKVSTPEKNRKLYWLTPLLGLLLIAAVAITACGPAAGSEPPATPTSQLNPIAQATLTPQPTPEPPVVEEPAPIESVAIEVMAADPRQAELVVVLGLPNGCYTFKGHTMSRDGDTITVTVTNTRPDTPDLVCTEIYGMVTTRIPLTGDIEPCHTYTVIANGESHSAQASGPHVSCSASSGPNDAEISGLALARPSLSGTMA